MDFTLSTFSNLVESAIKDLSYPTVAPKLFAPIRYTLESGGKRLRPVLTLATYAALAKSDPQKAINQALAIEIFHNFTLLHDDVMDRADIRRGRPTVHRKWGATPPYYPATPCSHTLRSFSPAKPAITSLSCRSTSMKLPCRFTKDSNSIWNSKTATMSLSRNTSL